MLTRRFLLRNSALALAATPSWLNAGRKNVLVTVFLRGGADGLNMVVPFGERAYYRMRPSIAVPARSVLALDGFFGLHPALAPLKPIWDAGHLAIFPAGGWHHPSRAHWEAERLVGWPAAPLHSLDQIARLIRVDREIDLAFAEMRGWDHHVDEPARLPGKLTELAAALAGFWRGMGDRMADVIVAVYSEFGRAVRENETRGTDHGHGQVVFVMGGGVRGGIQGTWPGLESEQLYQGRDLEVTTGLGTGAAPVHPGEVTRAIWLASCGSACGRGPVWRASSRQASGSRSDA